MKKATSNTDTVSGGSVAVDASVLQFFIDYIHNVFCYPASEEKYISFLESHVGELQGLITAMITESDKLQLMKSLHGSAVVRKFFRIGRKLLVSY